MIRAGLLRERVTLQTETRTADGGGGYVSDWTPAAVVWARVEVLSGREIAIAQQLESAMTHRVTIRHRTGIDAAATRLAWRDSILVIIGDPRPDERRTVLVMDCERLGAEQ